MGMRSILLLRHGPADQSAPDAFIGRTNPALTEQGREIAKAAGRRLSHLQIGGVYTSPLIRCVQTGRLLGLENLPVETVEGLAERDGKALFDWANAGDAPAPKPVNKSVAEEELVADVPVAEKDKIEMAIDSINKLAKELADSGVAKKTISDTIKSVSGSANYNKITDFEVATDVYKELVALKNKED